MSKNSPDYNFNSIRFPIMYFNVDYHDPPFKLLENRIFDFLIFKDCKELLFNNAESFSQLANLYRLIDSNGTEYIASYSKQLGFNIPNNKAKQYSLIEVFKLIEPYTNELIGIDKQNILKSTSLPALFLNLYLLNE